MIPLLYIDPGTGSILFSIVIGLITTLYFLAKTAFIKLKVAVYKDKGKVAGKKKQYCDLFGRRSLLECIFPYM